MKKPQPLKIVFLFLIATFILSACYRIPNEDDYSVVPSVNNPDLTREKSSGFMPNMGF